ncbi:hypothetical protein BGZ60DRAFT_528099 [Tricladium varicosporioides]|nr:hypothetical protein BGZ60DRAFT_528099 [Hymenoscyphus varicosporioides]
MSNHDICTPEVFINKQRAYKIQQHKTPGPIKASVDLFQDLDTLVNEEIATAKSSTLGADSNLAFTVVRKTDQLFDRHYVKDKYRPPKQGPMMNKEGRWQGRIMLKDEFLLFAEIYVDMKIALVGCEGKVDGKGVGGAGRGTSGIPLLKKSDDEEFGTSNLSDEDDDSSENCLDPIIMKKWERSYESNFAEAFLLRKGES